MLQMRYRTWTYYTERSEGRDVGAMEARLDAAPDRSSVQARAYLSSRCSRGFAREPRDRRFARQPPGMLPIQREPAIGSAPHPCSAARSRSADRRHPNENARRSGRRLKQTASLVVDVVVLAVAQEQRADH